MWRTRQCVETITGDTFIIKMYINVSVEGTGVLLKQYWYDRGSTPLIYKVKIESRPQQFIFVFDLR